MEKIAQIVLTKTVNGMWKVTSMSLIRTENSQIFQFRDEATGFIEHIMTSFEWEQLSLDI